MDSLGDAEFKRAYENSHGVIHINLLTQVNWASAGVDLLPFDNNGYRPKMHTPRTWLRSDYLNILGASGEEIFEGDSIILPGMGKNGNEHRQLIISFYLPVEFIRGLTTDWRETPLSSGDNPAQLLAYHIDQDGIYPLPGGKPGNKYKRADLVYNNTENETTTISANITVTLNGMAVFPAVENKFVDGGSHIIHNS
ncbi:MAG: hypothetical protein JWO83_3513 [Caulobacteraceae bacterium]|nr:hypothetical protein [Caulobacteraceae bacterium]